MGMVRVEAESYAKIVCFAKKFELDVNGREPV